VAEPTIVPSAAADERPVQTTDTASKSTKWFHFRGRVLLVIPAAFLVIAIVYAPRQMAQQRAITALKELNVPIRTQPLIVPGVAQLFGEDYAVEITDVYMRDPQVNDEHLPVLSGLRSLQKLELAGSNITSAGLENLTRLPNLYTLHLADTKVTDDGLESLTRFPNLGILSLNNTPISNDGLTQIGKLPKLEHLFLDGTEISDAGLAHLSKLETLKELSCVGTKITDAGLPHLYGLNNLEVLKVYNTEVTRPALEELHQVLPNCIVWEPDE